MKAIAGILVAAMLITAIFAGCIGSNQDKAPPEENAPYHPPTFGKNYSTLDNRYVAEKFTGTLSVKSADGKLLLHGNVTMKMREDRKAEDDKAVFWMYQSMEVESIKENGAPVDYDVKVGAWALNEYTVPLDKGLEVSVAYAGNMVNAVLNDGDLNYALYASLDTYVMDIFFMPSFWDPNLEHNTPVSDYDITVMAPKFVKVVFTGNITDTKEDLLFTERRYTDRTCIPMLAASTTWIEKSDEVNGIPVKMYYYPYSETIYADYLEGIKESMMYYDALFKNYPYNTLTVFTAPNVFLALSSGGFARGGIIGILQGATDTPYIWTGGGSAGLGTTRPRSPMYHEHAHHWWGLGVAPEKFHGENTSNWLSEGFACYCDLLVRLKTDPESAKRSIEWWYESTMSDPDTPLSEASMDKNWLNYCKGPLVIRNLEYVFAASGKKDAFFDGLRAFLDRYWHKTANTMQFRQVMERYYDGDLGWFFDNWIFGTGFPDFEVKFVNGTSFTVKNTGNVRSPVNLTAIGTGGAEETKTIWLDMNGEETLNFEFSVEKVIVDRDWWVPERKEDNNAFENKER